VGSPDLSAVRLGIGGPVGSGKTKLIERLLPLLHQDGVRVAVITNDLVTREDAERLQGSGLIAEELVVGVETGACPHTAIREDPSLNISAADTLEQEHGPLDLVLIESGGDNLAATFSADLVDHWIYVIDVAGGDDIPRKRGLGIVQADLLVVNKIDLAPHVGADLERMREDLASVRPGRRTVFTDLAKEDGAAAVLEHVRALVPGGRACSVRAAAVEDPDQETMIVRFASKLEPHELLEQATRVGHAFGNQHVPVEVEGGEIRVPVTTSRELAARTVRGLRLRDAEITFAP
jgi:urease accessory protein